MSGIESNKNEGPKDNPKGLFPVFIDENGAHGHGSFLNRESRLPEIVGKIKDPRVSMAEVLRLISLEMALILQDMRTCGTDGAGAFKLKNCIEQIKALRAMVEVVMEIAEGWRIVTD